MGFRSALIMKMQDPIPLDPADIVRIDVRSNNDDELRAICRKLHLDADAVISARSEVAVLYIRRSECDVVALCYSPDPKAIFFDDAYGPVPRSVRDAIVAIPAIRPPEPRSPEEEERLLECFFETMEYKVDGILDKIAANGLDSLDEWEIAFLERRSRWV